MGRVDNDEDYVSIVWIIAATALLTSALTLGGAILVFRYLMRVHLGRLRKMLDEELTEIADTIEDRVRKGVDEGAREVLPEFRVEVREGFKEAMVSTVSGDVLTQTTQNVAKKGSQMLRAILFGDEGK